MAGMERRTFENFGEFYAFYLTQHQRPWTRLIHVTATLFALVWAFATALRGAAAWIPFGFVLAYGPAWLSHFFIEKNRPATFRYPFYSLASDFRFVLEIFTGKQRFGF